MPVTPLPPPRTELLHAPHGVDLEYLVAGTGQPVTLFAHGLGAGIADTRPLGSGVAGTRIFMQLRGHGRSAAPAGSWTYTDLAADVAAVADAHGATQALGVSLGAGALCRLLAQRPDRFDRLVFFLPAVLDTPRATAARRRLTAMLAAIADGDRAKVAEAVLHDVPVDLRDTPAARAYVRQRVDQLLRDGLGTSLGGLPDAVAVPDVTALAAVTAPALVITNAGDDLHPVEIARRLAGVLPRGRLHVYGRPGALWTDRADLRRRIGTFLSGRSPDADGAELGEGAR